MITTLKGTGWVFCKELWLTIGINMRLLMIRLDLLEGILGTPIWFRIIWVDCYLLERLSLWDLWRNQLDRKCLIFIDSCIGVLFLVIWAK